MCLSKLADWLIFLIYKLLQIVMSKPNDRLEVRRATWKWSIRMRASESRLLKVRLSRQWNSFAEIYDFVPAFIDWDPLKSNPVSCQIKRCVWIQKLWIHFEVFAARRVAHSSTPARGRRQVKRVLNIVVIAILCLKFTNFHRYRFGWN